MSQATGSRILDESPGTPDRWIVLTLVAVDYFVLYSQRSMLAFLKQPLMTDLELVADQFGWLGLAFNLPYALAQVGMGYLGDRFSRRTVLLWSLAGSALALAGIGFTRNYWEMLLLRVALGVAQAASVPAIAGAIADSFTPRSRSTAVAIYFMVYNLGLIAAATFTGQIADTRQWNFSLHSWMVIDVILPGWRMAFFLMAAGTGVYWALFWIFFQEPPRAQHQTSPGTSGALSFTKSLEHLLRIRTFWVLMIVFVLWSMVLSALELWLPGYMAHRFYLRLEDAAFHATVWLRLATVAGLYCGGRLSDFMARRWMVGRTLVQSAGLLLGVPSLILIGTGESIDLLAIPLAIYGFGIGFFQANLWPTTFEVVDPAARSTAIGLLNVASGLFGVWLNPIIGTYERKGGNLGTALEFLSNFLFLALIILMLSGKFLLPRDYRGTLKKMTKEQ